jgi:glycerol-3-phosphate dehydrogenase
VSKIAIIGAGSCGTALAIALGRSREHHRLSLWVHGSDVLTELRTAAKIPFICRACEFRMKPS